MGWEGGSFDLLLEQFRRKDQEMFIEVWNDIMDGGGGGDTL